jgi:hypothetical protein
MKGRAEDIRPALATPLRQRPAQPQRLPWPFEPRLRDEEPHFLDFEPFDFEPLPPHEGLLGLPQPPAP